MVVGRYHDATVPGLPSMALDGGFLMNFRDGLRPPCYQQRRRCLDRPGNHRLDLATVTPGGGVESPTFAQNLNAQ